MARENAIKELEKQIGVLKDSVERKLQVVIRNDHPIMAWIPQHAGFLLSRFQVSKDGKTAYERLKGKAYRGELVDFGERVTFMPVVLGSKMNKLEVKWEPGRFVGIRPSSGITFHWYPDFRKISCSSEAAPFYLRFLGASTDSVEGCLRLCSWAIFAARRDPARGVQEARLLCKVQRRVQRLGRLSAAGRGRGQKCRPQSLIRKGLTQRLVPT